MAERALRRLQNITGTAFPQHEKNTLSTSPCASSFFDDVKVPPPDAIFNVKRLAATDKDPRKINLGVGAYRDENGKPYLLNVVRKAQIAAVQNPKNNREYLGITGDAEYAALAAKLVFGADRPTLREGRVSSVQTLSGTGALRVAGEFVAKFLPGSTIYISDPTWGNHNAVFGKCGIKTAKYRYWNPSQRNLDIDGLLADLRAAPRRSVVLLHAAAHNPTGVDPTQAQWRQIADVCRANELFPFFDTAYQGFASGDLEVDAYAIRYFADLGFELLVCQSFAKNFGLYNARIGAVHVSTSSKGQKAAVSAQMAKIIRPMYSNPPADGARIVKAVLSDPALYAEWVGELKKMSHRIIEMRALLRSALERLGTPGDWSHITSQIGMFSYTGLSPKQCDELVHKHHVYLLGSGRISMAGINPGNCEYLAKSIDAVVRNA